MFVSVIMPTYNRADLLPFAIESVLGQTHTNLELIVVDDGSKDDTRTLVENYIKNDQRVKYLYQENQGQSVARNTGIENSRGELVAFLDSDNIWESNRLEVGVDLLCSDHSIGLCFADLIFIDLHNKEIHRNNMRRYGGFVFDRLIVDNFVSMNTVLVRRSILPSSRPFNETNRLDEDYELWLDLSVQNKYAYIPRCLARYRVEGDRVSNNFMRRLDANESTVFKIIKKYGIDVTHAGIRNGLSQHYLRRASVIGTNGALKDSLKSLFIAFNYKPFSGSSLRTLIRILRYRLLAK